MSNYKKVYERFLTRTPEGNSLIYDAKDAVKNTKILDYNIKGFLKGFDYSSDPNRTPYDISTIFKLKFGDFTIKVALENLQDPSTLISNQAIGRNTVNFSMGRFISNKFVEDLLELRFGKEKPFGVAKYGCSTFTIKNGNQGRGRPCQSFQDWAILYLYKCTSLLREQKSKEIFDEIIDLMSQDDYSQKYKEALNVLAIESIIDVMKGFGHLDKEILSKALDQYIVHDILDM